MDDSPEVSAILAVDSCKLGNAVLNLRPQLGDRRCERRNLLVEISDVLLALILGLLRARLLGLAPLVVGLLGREFVLQLRDELLQKPFDLCFHELGTNLGIR